ncbi:MAG: hypothetical protein QXF79_02010 [Ignisphaera sp.]
MIWVARSIMLITTWALLSSKSAHDLCIEWLVATVKGGVGAIHPRSTYENLGMGNSYSWLNIFA